MKMANYYATARTSYTKVKNPVAFRNWADTIPAAKIVTRETDDHGTLYGLLFGPDSDCGSVPCWRHDEELQDDYDLDVYKEIQEHIADGWSITIMEAGAEKYRYVIGHAAVVTPKEIEHIDLASWADETMNALGAQGTVCEY
jgi:hypothetical protein